MANKTTQSVKKSSKIINKKTPSQKAFLTREPGYIPLLRCLAENKQRPDFNRKLIKAIIKSRDLRPNFIKCIAECCAQIGKFIELNSTSITNNQKRIRKLINKQTSIGQKKRIILKRGTEFIPEIAQEVINYLTK